MKQPLRIDNDIIPVMYERRRYGKKTYCWAYFTLQGQIYSAGDPYPAVNFPLKLLTRIVQSCKQTPTTYFHLKFVKEPNQ